jgi:hypothetical protein
MSTASSICALLYPVLAGLLALGLASAGCNRNKKPAVDPDDLGKLRRIAQNLETAYARAPLPPMTEPAALVDRLDKWDDFRSCTVRTYVARKREADKRAREGTPRPSRHASIGDETIEECAVQMAVAKKDPSVCERLALDYEEPDGQMPLSAVRCWDTRARIFGEPDECPVVWMPADAPARNPECLALARRDQSLCPFTDSPGRCRALLTSDSASCGAPDSAPDCALALEYWQGSLPAGLGPPLVDPAAFKEKPLSATIDLRWTGNAHPQIRIQGPKAATGISWPAGKARPAFTEETTRFWGAELPPEAAQITWRLGDPAIKLAFAPAGATSGVRPLQPPSSSAAATFIAVWADDPRSFRRCQPGPLSKGEVRFEVSELRPGGIVSGEAQASKLECTDGTELELRASFRLVILDLR